MKNYPLFTEKQRALAAEAILNTQDKPKMECVIRSATTRNTEQNARHWARMEQFDHWACKKYGKCKGKEAWHYYFAGEVFGWIDIGKDGRAVPAQTKMQSPYQFAQMEEFIDEKADDWDIPLMDKKQWHEYKRAAGL